MSFFAVLLSPLLFSSVLLATFMRTEEGNRTQLMNTAIPNSFRPILSEISKCMQNKVPGVFTIFFIMDVLEVYQMAGV